MVTIWRLVVALTVVVGATGLVIASGAGEQNRSWYAACNLRAGVGHPASQNWFGPTRCSRDEAENDRRRHMSENDGEHGGNTVVLGSSRACR